MSRTTQGTRKSLHGLPELEGFTQFTFTDGGMAHPVYRAGLRASPPVLVLQELPGFVPGLQLFGRRLVAAGFQVYLPWLFGPFGKRTPVRNYLRLCISQEFARLRDGVSAPVTCWLRALVGQISAENGDQAVAAIGMCITGGFVIPLLIDPKVVAAVAAQPAIPISWRKAVAGISGSPNCSALNVAQQDIEACARRLATREGRLLAVRCRADRFCPPEKMARFRASFAVGLTVREYGDKATRNAAGERPHATYTKEYRLGTEDPRHYSREAFVDLIAFLRDGL